ncbi:MAG: hypothetical protein AAF674_20560 [Pseudomonadota bacterium]
MIKVRGLSDKSKAPPIFETTDLPEITADQSEIIWEKNGRQTTYTVKRTSVVVMPDGHRVDLTLVPKARPLTLRLLDAMDVLPLDGARFLIVMSVLLGMGLVIAAALAVVSHGFGVLGFFIWHAATMTALMVLIAVLIRALRQDHPHAQYFLGALAMASAILTYLLIRALFPSLGGIGGLIGIGGFDLDYQAFGRLTWQQREELLVVLAPWVPTVAILLRAVGRDIAAALLEKNVKAKG